MPTYQYRCTACGSDLEAVQKFTDPALTECPACGGSLRKVFNAVGVVFKGSGFYRTDSRAANGKATGDKVSSDGKTDSTGEKSDTKSGEKSGEKSGDKSGEKSGEKVAAKETGSGSSSGKQPAGAGNASKS